MTGHEPLPPLPGRVPGPADRAAGSTGAVPYESRLALTEERRRSKVEYQRKQRLAAQREAKDRRRKDARARERVKQLVELDKANRARKQANPTENPTDIFQPGGGGQRSPSLTRRRDGVQPVSTEGPVVIQVTEHSVLITYAPARVTTRDLPRTAMLLCSYMCLDMQKPQPQLSQPGS